MPVKKFAISVPAEVMQQVDGAARRRGVTRSRFIADVLQSVSKARTDAEITRRINQLLADPDIASEQRKTALAFGSAASPAGTEW